MTTGNIVSDGRSIVTVMKPDGTTSPVSVGRYVSKTWSGTDSRTQKVLVNRPAFSFPTRPDLDNRLPNETSQSFYRRRRKLLNEWLAQVRAFQASRAAFFAAKPKRTRLKMPSNPYTMEKTVRDDCPQFCYDPFLGWYAESMYPPGNPGHIPLDPKDHYAVLEKLRRRAYGSGFNPGIMGVEGHKTLKMIAASATQIRLALVALYNGSWRGIVRQLGEPTPQWAGKARDGFVGFHEGRKTLSQAWLGFQYGWLPLVKDLDDGAAWLAEIVAGGAATIYPKIRAKKAFVKQKWYDPSQFYSRCGFSLQVSIHRVLYIIEDLKVAPATSMPSLPSLAAVAWEAVPYSFVCDWVAPIGSYLQALRTSKDLTGKVLCTVFTETYYDFPNQKKGVVRVPVYPSAPSGYRIYSVVRTVTDEINPPTPLGDLSPSSVFSRWQRAANSVALLQNLRFPELDRTGFKKLFGRKA